MVRLQLNYCTEYFVQGILYGVMAKGMIKSKVIFMPHL